MSKAENVVKYYVLCNNLKYVIRTGWKDWNVNKERLESVAEHIYGVQMLAIGMYSEYQYDINLVKVLYMLAIHELEEIIIGDLTMFQISKEEKDKIGHDAVIKILSGLLNKDELMTLVLEFDARDTKEAQFAFYCDKLECDIQCKLYDEEGCVDLEHQEENKSYYNEDFQELLSQGKSWSEMWLLFGQKRYKYDEHFKEVSDYAIKNDLHKFKSLDY